MKPSLAALMTGAFLCATAGPALADYAQEFTRQAAERDVATFRSLDRNVDGRLSFAEVDGDVEMQARFRDMDIDGDGAVTPAELAHYIRWRYGIDVPATMDTTAQPSNVGAPPSRPAR